MLKIAVIVLLVAVVVSEIPDLPVNVSFPVITSGCECYENAGFGAPDLCGQWAENATTSGDYICYVFPLCTCAHDSQMYPLLKWRYCGSSLSEMQLKLNFTGDRNMLEEQEIGSGVCSNVDSSLDVIAPAASPPAGLTDCPVDACVDEAGECCGFTGGVCTTTSRTRYSYVGDCAQSGFQVWQFDQNPSITCTCPPQNY